MTSDHVKLEVARNTAPWRALAIRSARTSAQPAHA
jgi:hypothetical protein